MPGFAAPSEFQRQILNLFVPRGYRSLDPSLIRAETLFLGGEESIIVVKHGDIHGFMDFLQLGYGAVIKVFNELERKVVRKWGIFVLSSINSCL